MSADPNTHFQTELLVELDDLQKSIDKLGGLWGRAINHGGVRRELTAELKRKLGVVKSAKRDLEKLATGETE